MVVSTVMLVDATRRITMLLTSGFKGVGGVTYVGSTTAFLRAVKTVHNTTPRKIGSFFVELKNMRTIYKV